MLFARLAARDGGRSVVDLGTILEMAGRFEEARAVYLTAEGSAVDPHVREWLAGRIMGTCSLDTILVLSVVITNEGPGEAEDIELRIPLPESHPPYQSIEIMGGVFRRDGDQMTADLPGLPPGGRAVMPLLLRVRQEPYTFRPLSPLREGTDLRALSAHALSLQLAESDSTPGPCLDAAFAMKEWAEMSGTGLSVTGGLIRTQENGLLFHAWNHTSSEGIPLDVSLLQRDSLRGICHCPTDLIPLWDLEGTGGHEVSAFYSQPDADISVSMEAAFADRPLIEQLLRTFPLCLLGKV